MALPRYKADPTLAKPTGGSGQIAAYQAEAQSASNLAQRLAQFSGQLLDMGQKQVQIEAVEDARRDVFNRKQEIVNIRKTTKDPIEAQKKIDEITLAQKKSNFGLYGRAYNTAAEAAYTNQVTLDAKEAHNRALIESKGNSTIYQTIMREFKEKTAASAPSKETGIVAGQIAHEKGLEGYKTLKLKEQAEANKYNDKNLQNMILERGQDYQNAFAKGNSIDAQNALDQIEVAMLQSGKYSPEVIKSYLEDIKENAIVNKVKYDFDIAESQNKGNEFIQNFWKDEKYRDKLNTETFTSTWSYLKRQYKNNQTAKTQANTQMVNETIKVLDAGFMPENLAFVQNLELNPKQKRDLAKSVAVYNEYQKYQDMSLPELQTKIATMKSKDTANILEVEFLEKAESVLKEKFRMAKQDPVTLGMQDGTTPVTKPITLGDMSALPKRLTNSSVTSRQYGVEKKVLTDVEANEFSTWANNPDTKIEDKISKLYEIQSLLKDDSYLLYKQVTNKGARSFAMAGSLISQGDSQTARDILKGEIILKETPKAIPEDIAYDIADSLGNTFSHVEGGTREQFTDAIRAVYASISERNGTLGTDKASADDMEEAILRVTGGIFKYNDKKILAPKLGVTEDDFEDWIENPTVETYPIGITSKEHFNDTLEYAELESLGNGRYAVTYNGMYLKDRNNQKYVLEYK